MAIFEALNNIDTRLLLGINGAHNPYFDAFFTFFTSKEVWFPFYVVMLVVIMLKYKRTGIWLILMLILTIAITDQVSVLIKVLVERPRPSHAAALAGSLNLPIGQRGMYGFVSSHAANAFALTVMIAFLSKCKRLWQPLLLWALITGYSRIYLGVHYPFDVLGGAVLGALIGWGMYKLTMWFDDRFLGKRIAFAGSCENHQITPILISLLITTVTVAIVAMIVLRYQL